MIARQQIQSPFEGGARRAGDVTTHAIRIALLTALAGSLWATLAKEACTTCEDAANLAGNLPLAPLGIAGYAALLILFVARPHSRSGLYALLAAGGVHAGLAIQLIAQRLVCPPCILTALGAWSALALALRVHRPKWDNAVIAFSLAALAAYGGIATYASFRAEHIAQQAESLRQQLMAEGVRAPEAGGVRLVIFRRDGCHYCDRLEHEILPQLSAEDREGLIIEYRTAPEGYVTPSLVVIGPKASRAFGGMPGVTQLVENVWLCRAE